MGTPQRVAMLLTGNLYIPLAEALWQARQALFLGEVPPVGLRLSSRCGPFSCPLWSATTGNERV